MLKKLFMAAALFVLAAAVAPQQASAASDGYNHHVVFQINANDPALMNLVLNNVENVIEMYGSKGQKVQIEVVAYGPGLEMLIDGKSPVTARIQNISANTDNVTFSACGNTKGKMEKKSGKPVTLLDFSDVRVVPAGVVRIMELQDAGWHYIKP